MRKEYFVAAMTGVFVFAVLLVFLPRSDSQKRLAVIGVSPLPSPVAKPIETPTDSPFPQTCSNANEIRTLKLPIPVVWDAQLTGCLTGCLGAHFSRWPLAGKYQYTRFAAYMPNDETIADRFLATGLVLRIHGRWSSVDDDHANTVFDGKCVPIVNITSIEIIGHR